MPSIAIYGDSGMGKTMIMKRFRDEHPPSFNPLTGTLKTPVLAMEMTSRPGERRFYAELLTLLGAPQRPRADIAQMEQAALRIMEAIGVQVLVIDEVHNILAGSYREQRIVLNTLASSAIVCRSPWSASASTRRGRRSAATSSLRAGSSSSP
jgi:GTPase SAR1 family protein